MTENPFVELLAAYGPQPHGNAMYDEFVRDEADALGVAPLDVPEDSSAHLAACLRADPPVSMILTGTAGDGKTFTLRRAAEALGASWSPSAPELEIVLPSGHRALLVKDVSELDEAGKAALAPRLLAALAGRGDPVAVCVNDGQLLAFLRRYAEGDPSAARVAEMLRDGERKDPEGRFELINMSRRGHGETLERILDAVLDPMRWDCPAACPVLEGCPIRRNRSVLMKAGPATPRARLRALIELSAMDDRHLSFRQVVILVVNALLGDRKGKNPLMGCAQAKARAEDEDWAATDPFDNLFGANHGRPQGRAAFRVLAGFDVGMRTTNTHDALILDGARTEGDEPYGPGLTRRTLANYDALPEAPEVSRRVVEDATAALRRERRRLFLTLPDDADPWRLTRLPHGQAVLAVAKALREGSAVDGTLRRRILIGLNRCLTGLMTEAGDAAWFPEPFGEGGTVPLIRGEPIGWHAAFGAPHLSLVAPDGAVGSGRPPELRVVHGNRCLSALRLTPTLLDMLLQVADGVVPASAGALSLQEIRTFQITTVGAITRLLGDAPLRAVELDARDGTLTAKPLGLLETA